MKNSRMTTSKRINMIKEMRLHYKIRRSGLKYSFLTLVKKYLALAVEAVDKMIEET